MVELYREKRKDYKTFIRIKTDQFQEFVVRRRSDIAASSSSRGVGKTSLTPAT